MAHATLDNTGTNASNSSSLALDSDTTYNLVMMNTAASAVTVKLSSDTDVNFNPNHSQFGPSNGNHYLLDETSTAITYRLGAGASAFFQCVTSDVANLRIDAGDVTTTHGTSSSSDDRIWFGTV